MLITLALFLAHNYHFPVKFIHQKHLCNLILNQKLAEHTSITLQFPNIASTTASRYGIPTVAGLLHVLKKTIHYFQNSCNNLCHSHTLITCCCYSSLPGWRTIHWRLIISWWNSLCSHSCQANKLWIKLMFETDSILKAKEVAYLFKGRREVFISPILVTGLPDPKKLAQQREATCSKCKDSCLTLGETFPMFYVSLCTLFCD